MQDPLTKVDTWPDNVLIPSLRLVSLLTTEMEMSGMTKRALIHLADSGLLMQTVQMYLEKDGLPEGAAMLEGMLEYAPKNVAWAEAARSSDFADVHRHSLVAMWAIVVSAVEETAVFALIGDVNAVAGLKRIGARAPKETESPNRAEARQLLRRAEGKLPSTTSGWSNRKETIFTALGFSLSLDPTHCRIIEEVNAVRNCLLHRDGRIDDDAVTKAPGLAQYLGRTFEIREAYYLEAFDAFSHIAVALSKSAARYIRERSTSK